ncbi:MAG: septum formation inhibitor Maf [Pusillimonas sp.]|nr:septum formation inhibitor Maf [Pusillimonas sp.]
MMLKYEIYLASASPRRHEILNQMGISHRVLIVPSPPGEDEPRLPGEEPERYVMRTALEKSDRALAWIKHQSLPSLPVLTADTTVALSNVILGKPKSSDEAKLMLSQLSGRVHCVYTAVTLAFGEQRIGALSATEVRFAELSMNDIDAYCRTGEPWGKAGAYGIQGKASLFVQHIHGSYSGVVGLPIYETGQLLRQLGESHTD